MRLLDCACVMYHPRDGSDVAAERGKGGPAALVQAKTCGRRMRLAACSVDCSKKFYIKRIYKSELFSAEHRPFGQLNEMLINVNL